MPDLFTKPLDQLVKADVEAVIGWPESTVVEYKQDLPGRDTGQSGWHTGGDVEPSAKTRLFKEIVALANTAGGHLVLGITETHGEKPASAASISAIPRCAELAERLGKAAQVIDPPIPQLQVWGVQTEPNGSGVVVFRVPASRSAPHRGPDRECYVRRNTDSVPVSMRDIQDLTLAMMRRGDRVTEMLRRHKDHFSEWFESACRQEEPPKFDNEIFGFRVSAIPVGADFEVPRLYGRTGIFNIRDEYQIAYLGESQSLIISAVAADRPDRERPIVRGTRLENREPSLSYMDIQTNGAVSLGFRRPSWRAANTLSLYMGWIAAHAVNVLTAADYLRTEAGLPDCEYAVEVEIASTGIMRGPVRIAGPPVLVKGWSHGGFGNSGTINGPRLVFPTYSFGPFSELGEFLTQLTSDVYDAAGCGMVVPPKIQMSPQ
jgi:hypothetical protein